MSGASQLRSSNEELVVADASEIPEYLRLQHRWITWKPELRNGRVTKRPVDAKVNDPQTWLPFDDARARAIAQGGGIGYILGDGVVGIDFDGCVDLDGELHPAVVKAVRALASYAEFSPSERGVHILMRGTIERARKLSATATAPARELYAEGRYFTVTGRRVPFAPPRLADGPEAQRALDCVVAELFADIQSSRPQAAEDRVNLSDDRVLALLAVASNRKKAARLLAGDSSGYSSDSEADFALVRILRFYTREPQQLDRLFRQSGLMRPKWDAARGSATYGATTIANALARGGPVFLPRTGNEETRRLLRERASYASHVPLWWVVRLHGVGELALRVLWTIATYANDKGEAWPSIPAIAFHCRVSDRRVKEALATLARFPDVIRKTRRAGVSSTVYILASTVSEVSTPDAPWGRASASIRGAGSHVIRGVGSQHPKETNKATNILTQERDRRVAAKIITLPEPVKKAAGE